VILTASRQGIGILYTVERSLLTYEDTNQEYLTRTLRTLHDRLLGLFHRFVDDQVRGIEDTKVKLKKRKGIISFMRTFPNFSAAVESMLPPPSAMGIGNVNEPLEVRLIVNEAYTKLNKAMWECLNFIAKDEPGSSSAGHSGGIHVGSTSAAHAIAGNANDPEDKEALNYHILLIENMNHYLEEVDERSNPILKQWRERASEDLASHLAQYTDAVIRRPLGKWLDFVESTEAMLKSLNTTTSSSISSSTADNASSGSANNTTLASRPSHSRSTTKKLLSAHDTKEIRKGIETLKKRIEKHFGDGDDPALARSLVAKVFAECAGRYAGAWERMGRVIEMVYAGEGGGGSLEIEWRREEVVALFKR
jgi:exocyst complex component 1